jgi:threonine aldolase
MKVVDLRSDTITKPTPEMREEMAIAEVGDDVYGEDPTANELESIAAEVVGKEAALFVPSGTMGNQIAVMTHTQPGNEIILGKESHIFYYEVGGLAKLSGVQARTLDDSSGIFNSEDLELAIRGENIHYPETGLVCLENTHNRAGGLSVPKEKIDEICEEAHDLGVSVHLDGARIFNAALELEVGVVDLVENADSIMFCLSKGLAAPIGSILAGSKEFINQARKNRKMLGGGMRQAGVIAQAGIIALEKMMNRLENDHKLATKLANGVKELDLKGIGVKATNTNFVILEVDEKLYETEDFLKKLNNKGVRMTYFGAGLVRAVSNKDVVAEDVDYTINVLSDF